GAKDVGLVVHGLPGLVALAAARECARAIPRELAGNEVEAARAHALRVEAPRARRVFGRDGVRHRFSSSGGRLQARARAAASTLSKSTLPPLTMTPTRWPRAATAPSSSAAAGSAPVGSTTIFMRFQSSRVAATIA